MRPSYNGLAMMDAEKTAFELPRQALAALALLEQAGHEAWLVGGCVRDHYLGRQPEDYDIATAAQPTQMLALFSAHRTLKQGLRHGTVTLLMEGMALEVTTYRSDGAYSDSRHPDQVTFVTSLKEDLARRDFTCNAMAYHPQRGLYDPFLGRADCDRRLIRAVGDPELRFREDALRILRALRFASQLGFGIEDKTGQAMLALGSGLGMVSAERVASELNRTLTGRHAASALQTAPRTLLPVLPELGPLLQAALDPPFAAREAWEHSLRTLYESPPDLALRWAALFLGSGGPLAMPGDHNSLSGDRAASAARLLAAMTRLKQPTALREQATALVRLMDERITPHTLSLHLSRLGPDTTLKLLLLQRAALLAQGPAPAGPELEQLDALYEEAQRILQSGEALRVKDLDITGDDMIALGYPRDSSLGRALDTLLDQVLRGELDNRREALLARAKHLLRPGGEASKGEPGAQGPAL